MQNYHADIASELITQSSKRTVDNRRLWVCFENSGKFVRDCVKTDIAKIAKCHPIGKIIFERQGCQKWSENKNGKQNINNQSGKDTQTPFGKIGLVVLAAKKALRD